MRTKSTINKLILTLLSSFLFFAFSFQLQGQSVDLLDKEAGYKDFKLGQVISDVSAYQLDAKRSTKKLKAYVHKGSDCKEFNGVEIDGIVLYLNEKKELTQIEFLAEEVISVKKLGNYFSSLQQHYGVFSDYTLATDMKTTSSFFWETRTHKLIMKIIPIDASHQKYKTKLIFLKK